MSNNALTSIASSAYDGTAEIGKGMAIITLMIGVIIAICLCVSGCWSIFQDDSSEWSTTSAQVTESSCSKITSGNSTKYKCDMKITYSVGDETFEDQIFTKTSSTQYSVGSNVDIEYETANPSTFREPSISIRYMGSIVLCVAVVIVLCTTIHYWLTRKSKLYAAASGTSTVIDVLT